MASVGSDTRLTRLRRGHLARPAQFPHLHGGRRASPFAGVELVVAGQLFAEILRQRGKHRFAVFGDHPVISGDDVKAALLAFGITLERPPQTGQTRAAGGLGFGGGFLGWFDGKSSHARHGRASVAVLVAVAASVAVGRALRAGAARDRPRRGRINEIIFGGVIEFLDGAPIYGIADGDGRFA